MTASEWGALALLEGFVVEDEAVLDVVAEDAVVGFVELVVGGELDVGDDTLVGAEVEHLLGFFHAANGGACEGAAVRKQREWRDGERLVGEADEAEGGVELEQREVGVDVVRGGDAVEDEVEAAGVLLHGGGVF